jgi:hypothetical protein
LRVGQPLLEAISDLSFFIITTTVGMTVDISYSWLSIFASSASADSTNCGLKFFLIVSLQTFSCHYSLNNIV